MYYKINLGKPPDFLECHNTAPDDPDQWRKGPDGKPYIMTLVGSQPFSRWTVRYDKNTETIVAKTEAELAADRAALATALAKMRTAATEIKNIPGWATMTAAEAQTAIDAVTDLAGAKNVMKKMAIMLIYMRNLFGLLPEE